MKNKITFILSPIILFVLYLSLSSSSGGINGQSVAGCTCHGAASPSTVVTITGLPAGGYTNSTVYPITVSVTNTTLVGTSPFGLGDGFDLTSTSGSFTAIAGTALNGATEIRHSARKVPVSGTASWTFNWTAPAVGSANITFAVSGNATNGNGSTLGDAWNQTSTTIYKAGAVLAVTATAPAITCNGGVVTITATGSGPTVPYMYSRNGAAFQSSGTFTNNLAGTYTITVRNSALATATTTLTLTQPTLVVLGTTSNTPINCNGGTSTVTTSATGGTGAFTYRLNLGAYQSSGTFNNVAAGTYTVTARDANLCTKTTTLVITAPTAMVFSVPSVTPPACNGATGSVTTTATGGTGSKTYTISPLGPQSNATGSFAGLTAQGYTVTATDANNCIKTTLIIISQPSAVVFGTPFISHPPCNGNAGSVSISATGGTGIKTYTITPLGPQSNTSGVFTGLIAQTYTITATDVAGCTSVTSINVLENAPLVFNTPTIVNPICNNGSTGTISITANGGTLSKTYTINPLGSQSNSTGNFNGLTAQNYTVTITDGNGCTLTSAISLNNPNPIIVTTSDFSACEGNSIALSGTPSGGVFSVANPYTGTSTSFTYTYEDGNGCIGIDTGYISSQSFTLNTIVLPSNVCTGGSSLLAIRPTGQNCIPASFYGGCSFEHITHVGFGSISNTTPCDSTGYHDYTNITTTVTAGNSYSISLQDGAFFGGDVWHVWIDYNHNGVFESPYEHTEYQAGGTNSQFQIYVPTTAINGQTKMRVRLVYVGPADACGTTNWGEAEDYGITIVGGVTNNNPPFSYQWNTPQFSTLTTPTNDSTVANNILETETFTVTVTSSDGCTSVASAPVFATTLNMIDSLSATPTNVCPGGSSVLSFVPSVVSSTYCIPSNAINGCNNVEFIQQVNFGSINNITSCDTIGYKDYTSMSTTVSAGSTYTISLTDGQYFLGDIWGVWIDYNQNKNFEDPGEFVSLSPNAAIATGNIIIPANAYNGTTRMRVRLTYAGGLEPCNISSWGEIEDYSVVITGGINPPPFITYEWSNNLNSTLNSTSNPTVTATNITANEVYYIKATRHDGCFETDSIGVNINCGSTLNIKCYLQGYYNASGLMVPALMNQGIGASATLTDSIEVQLRDVNSPYGVIDSKMAALNTDGTATCTFTTTGTYYIAINHRNTVQSWSATPIALGTSTNYVFADAISKTYGDNAVEVEPGVWAFYTGDLNTDENVDLLDAGIVEIDISNFEFGYFATDLNGDGNVDLLDVPIIENNINNFIFSSHP